MPTNGSKGAQRSSQHWQVCLWGTDDVAMSGGQSGLCAGVPRTYHTECDRRRAAVDVRCSAQATENADKMSRRGLLSAVPLVLVASTGMASAGKHITRAVTVTWMGSSLLKELDQLHVC